MGQMDLLARCRNKVRPANTRLCSQAILYPSSFSRTSLPRAPLLIRGTTRSPSLFPPIGTLTIVVLLPLPLARALPRPREISLPSVSSLPSSVSASSAKNDPPVALGGGLCISRGKKLRGKTLDPFRKLSGISLVLTPSSVTRIRRRDPRTLSSTRMNLRFLASGMSGKSPAGSSLSAPALCRAVAMADPWPMAPGYGDGLALYPVNTCAGLTSSPDGGA